jgi:hypothetical protein
MVVTRSSNRINTQSAQTVTTPNLPSPAPTNNKFSSPSPKKNVASNKKTPPRGNSAPQGTPQGNNKGFGTNTLSSLDYQSQQVLLRLIQQSGGFLFIENRIDELLDKKEAQEAFGSKGRRKAAKDKVQHWSKLPLGQLNRLCKNFKVNILESSSGAVSSTPAIETASKSPKKQEENPCLIEEEEEESRAPPTKPIVSFSQVVAPPSFEAPPKVSPEKSRVVMVAPSESSKHADYPSHLPPGARYGMHEVDWEYPEDNHGFRFFLSGEYRP